MLTKLTMAWSLKITLLVTMITETKLQYLYPRNPKQRDKNSFTYPFIISAFLQFFTDKQSKWICFFYQHWKTSIAKLFRCRELYRSIGSQKIFSHDILSIITARSMRPFSVISVSWVELGWCNKKNTWKANLFMVQCKK